VRFLLPYAVQVESLHEKADPSACQAAARVGVSHSSVLQARAKLGIVWGGPAIGNTFGDQVPVG
jgi:hypothetical protein